MKSTTKPTKSARGGATLFGVPATPRAPCGVAPPVADTCGACACYDPKRFSCGSSAWAEDWPDRSPDEEACSVFEERGVEVDVLYALVEREHGCARASAGKAPDGVEDDVGPRYAHDLHTGAHAAVGDGGAVNLEALVDDRRGPAGVHTAPEDDLDVEPQHGVVDRKPGVFGAEQVGLVPELKADVTSGGAGSEHGVVLEQKVASGNNVVHETREVPLKGARAVALEPVVELIDERAATCVVRGDNVTANFVTGNDEVVFGDEVVVSAQPDERLGRAADLDEHLAPGSKVLPVDDDAVGRTVHDVAFEGDLDAGRKVGAPVEPADGHHTGPGDRVVLEPHAGARVEGPFGDEDGRLGPRADPARSEFEDQGAEVCVGERHDEDVRGANVGNMLLDAGDGAVRRQEDAGDEVGPRPEVVAGQEVAS